MSKDKLSFAKYLPSAEEMADFDRQTIAGGISSEKLMERAGECMAQLITDKYFKKNKHSVSSLCVLCGPGNNGGDGFVVARKLRKKVKNIFVVLAGAKRYSKDNLLQAKKYLEGGGKICFFSDKASASYIKHQRISKINTTILAEMLSQSSLILDALLGTGQKENPRGTVAKLVAAVSAAPPHAQIVALDIPTGVNATSGELYSAFIKADRTISVEFVKRGMLQDPAREACGKIRTASIGIKASKPSEFKLLDEETLPLVKKRKLAGHKGSYGHVLVIGGSKNLPGAPLLSSYAALRSGAGLVTMTKLTSFNDLKSRPEIMLKYLDSKEGYYTDKHIAEIENEISKFSVLVVGPGMRQNKLSYKFFQKLLAVIISKKIPTVIDADGLNFLSLMSTNKKQFKLNNCVLTPHPGEAGRLLSISTKEIQKDRYLSAKRLAQKFNCVAVLKGAGSIVYSGKEGVVNSTGNPYMASGGSGDVLSGIIAAFIAQGINLFEAAQLAVYVHGLSADLVYKKTGSPLIAGDIIDYLPKALSNRL